MKSVTKLVFPSRFVHTLSEGFIKYVLQSPLVDLGACKECMSLPLFNVFIFIFMQFSANTMPNNRLAPHSGVGAPSGKSWIRHCKSLTTASGTRQTRFPFPVSVDSGRSRFLSKGVNPILIQFFYKKT